MKQNKGKKVQKTGFIELNQSELNYVSGGSAPGKDIDVSEYRTVGETPHPRQRYKPKNG